MKQIVMLQGMGNNERGWARLVSKFGRVVMIQQGMIQHVEIWEKESCIFCGPEKSLSTTRKLDELTFSMLTVMRSLRRIREFARPGRIDVIIAPNYNMGFAALFLRWIGRTRKVVVWLSDYLPPRGSLAVRMHRRATGALNRWVAACADEVWTVSPRIPAAAVNPRTFVVPICLNEADPHTTNRRTEIGYIGIPTSDHALDILFDIGRRHRFRINIIGDSKYLQEIRHLAPPETCFHGLLNDRNRIDEILSRCFCGYAVYRNTGPQSYSYYGMPSKALAFLGNNTPVVTTNTAHFTKELAAAGVGHVVEPTVEEIERAILSIHADFEQFAVAINRFRDRWNKFSEEFHQARFNTLLDAEVSGGQSHSVGRGCTLD